MTTRPWIAAALTGAAWLLVSCATPAASPTTDAPSGPKPALGTFGFDVAGMDRGVAPGDDFNAYASGKWTAAAVIPADRSSLTGFSTVNAVAQTRTRDLLEGAAADSQASGPARQAGDSYASFMDEAAIEAKGAAPLAPELEAIAAIGTRGQLAAALGATLRADVDVLNATNLHTDRLFGLWVTEDFANPKTYAPYLLQGGLQMPDRDYYLADNPRFVALREQYRGHIANLLKMTGVAGDDAAARAQKVYDLEAAIAKVHWSATESSDVEKGYNPWKRRDFARMAPGLDWDAWFQAAGLASQPTVVVWQPSAIKGISALTRSQPLPVWKDYLAFHAAERAAPYLSKAFVDEAFAFNGRALSGTPEQSPRWKRAVGFTNGDIGEAVGELYVAKYFPPEAKAQAEALVRNVKAGFDARIERVAWMSPQTKARAHAKLARMSVGVGYPDKWIDYSKLTILRGDALGNHLRAERFEYQRQLDLIGQPSDRTVWHLLPQDVNALNAPLQNSIVFPAAILAPPFFDAAADPAINYGAIGGVIGHEISHGFDDSGALFDENGRMSNWWTPQDLARFKAAGRALAQQYDGYRPLPDQAINGELTLGENIADVAGLASAYDAYRLSLNGAEPPVLDGFTGDQRVFLGWAQQYRSKQREAGLRRQLLTDPHSPGPWRAATVRNIDAWYAAFGVKPGQGLYLAPEQRVTVW